MSDDDVLTRARRATKRPLSRRELLQGRGVLFRTAALRASASFAAAGRIAGAHTAAADAAAGVIQPGRLTVKASEANGYPLFSIDTLAVLAGSLAVKFGVTGNLKHELWVYPVQDVSNLMDSKRAGAAVSVRDYLKRLVAQIGEVGTGLTKTVQATVTPGLYELSAFVTAADADRTSFCHFDAGQPLTVAAVGAGGPSASVATPTNIINVDMAPGTGVLADSWLFVPDRLTAKAGEVSFTVNNQMPTNHDFVVYPLGDISAFIASRFAGQEDYSPIQGTKLVGNLPADQSARNTISLTPGWWAAACFMISQNPDGTTFLHRDKGERFTFLVQ